MQEINSLLYSGDELGKSLFVAGFFSESFPEGHPKSLVRVQFWIIYPIQCLVPLNPEVGSKGYHK